MIVSLMTLLLVGCGDEPQTTTGKTEASTQVQEVVEKKAKVDPPKPAQEPLMGDPVPSLLVTQAWFWKDEWRFSTGPARLKSGVQSGWLGTYVWRIQIPMYFTKPFPLNRVDHWYERALLKHWTMQDDRWNSETLWGAIGKVKFNRLRDIEVGDVNDGKEDLVIATAMLVVAVIEPKTLILNRH